MHGGIQDDVFSELLVGSVNRWDCFVGISHDKVIDIFIKIVINQFVLDLRSSSCSPDLGSFGFQIHTIVHLFVDLEQIYWLDIRSDI